jgi:hypothetical protein
VTQWSNDFQKGTGYVRVKAGGNVNDTATGSGARAITVEGITLNAGVLAMEQETIALAGASASAYTTKTFIRVFRAWVSDINTGTYDANAGDIVIEQNIATVGWRDIIKIGAGEGQTLYAGFAIPTGFTGYLLSAHITVDSGKNVNIRCFTRDNLAMAATGVAESKRLKLHWDGITGSFVYKPTTPEIILPAESDIWFEAYGNGAIAQVSCDFELVLVEDD